MVMFTFLSMLIGVAKSVISGPKKIKKSTQMLSEIGIKNFFLLTFYLFCTVICPILLIYASKRFDGFIYWSLQILSWSVLCGFFLAVAFIFHIHKEMMS